MCLPDSVKVLCETHATPLPIVVELMRVAFVALDVAAWCALSMCLTVLVTSLFCSAYLRVRG